MALKEVRREQAQAFDETKEVMADTKRRLDDIVGVQRDFFFEASRHWMNRVQTETNLVSELTAKLSAARSVPDAMSAYQEWATRRIEMMMKDTRRLWDDAQKFMAIGTNGLSVGT